MELLRARGLPLPQTNKPKGSYRVDCRWPGHALTVELDSYRFRDDFRRYTWGDDFEDRRLMLAELEDLLRPPPRRRTAARSPST